MGIYLTIIDLFHVEHSKVAEASGEIREMERKCRSEYLHPNITCKN